ncbi:hypothetical protein R3P38DRAFT_2843581 [Favolaschia claudopus]|uniref:Uncharacterized protein n=1 Tax=Favolaschia claudopus TaxID=2862362 RepID=A0AAW0E1Y8_9AGAR
MSTLFGSAPAPPETSMSLQSSLVIGPQSLSFEEVRISDYLTSYRSTGRPPPPCPTYPSDPAARAAQGMPPLFVPAPFPGAPSTSTSASTAPTSLFASGAASTSAITDPTRLPLPQVFSEATAVTTGAERESFASIAMAPEYRHWSPEELRYYAYFRGMRAPPPGTAMFALTPPPTLPGGAPVQDGGDTLTNITCCPEFSRHSPEELRLSFLRTGTELTSAQILAGVTTPSQPNHVAAPPTNQFNPPSIFGAPPSQTQPQPQPPTLFGAPAPPAQPPSMFGSRPAGQVWGAPQPPAPIQPTPSGGGGGFAFGNPPAALTQAQPAGGGFAFGAPAAPQQPAAFSFGVPAPAPPAAPVSQFSFGATPAAGGGAGTGFSFGARRF